MTNQPKVKTSQELRKVPYRSYLENQVLMSVLSILSVMAANLFSRLERFREESQVMAGHWSIAQNHESGVTQSHSQSYS